MVKKVFEERRRRDHPEDYEQEDLEQSERLKAFLHAVNDDMKTPSKLQKPKSKTKMSLAPTAPFQKAKPQKEFAFKPLSDAYHIAGDERKPGLDIKDRYTTSYIQTKAILGHGLRFPSNTCRPKDKALQKSKMASLLRTHVQDKRDLIIVYEIIAKPKALQHD